MFAATFSTCSIVSQSSRLVMYMSEDVKDKERDWIFFDRENRVDRKRAR